MWQTIYFGGWGRGLHGRARICLRQNTGNFRSILCFTWSRFQLFLLWEKVLFTHMLQQEIGSVTCTNELLYQYLNLTHISVRFETLIWEREVIRNELLYHWTWPICQSVLKCLWVAFSDVQFCPVCIRRQWLKKKYKFGRQFALVTWIHPVDYLRPIETTCTLS